MCHLRARYVLLAVLLFVLPVSAFAQDYAFDLLYDADGSTATGGPVTVVQGAEMPHDETGVDYLVRALVRFAGAPATLPAQGAGLVLPAEVLDVGVLAWNGAAFDGSLAPTGYAVGLGNGTGGGSVVEWQVPLADVGGMPQGGARGLFHVSQLAAENDYTSSFVLAAPSVLEIPTLAGWGLALLALLLAASAAVVLRRRRSAAMALAAAALLVAGAAWAAGGFAMDGMVDDWSGRAATVTDPSGDSSNGDPREDVLTCWAVAEDGYLTLRCDVSGGLPAPE